MERNIGEIDRIIRVLLLLIVWIVFYDFFLSKALTTLLIVFAIVLLFTVITAYDPFYKLFNFKTIDP